ncbi:Acyl-CoA carboxylase epsilon subunit [Amycolatopsis xylanica]|uniref:Acyl-CoA carboxylase epsilon subunit n=1 Tax=Amycolatopsis xylanica TaxID=589385 RepID=A0A1H3D5U6_9PSEU|nr:acyl-CoA carboxylase subunit epsilon [Amycolatopsis xylanica]SDX61498.1 Acyl-CoA carboxylase epsilon subunit [Amycolatopsis xylanica]
MTEIRIERGVPDAEELAALIAVLASLAAQPRPVRHAPVSRWRGPAWRESTLDSTRLR